MWPPAGSSSAALGVLLAGRTRSPRDPGTSAGRGHSQLLLPAANFLPTAGRRQLLPESTPPGATPNTHSRRALSGQQVPTAPGVGFVLTRTHQPVAGGKATHGLQRPNCDLHTQLLVRSPQLAGNPWHSGSPSLGSSGKLFKAPSAGTPRRMTDTQGPSRRQLTEAWATEGTAAAPPTTPKRAIPLSSLKFEPGAGGTEGRRRRGPADIAVLRGSPAVSA